MNLNKEKGKANHIASVLDEQEDNLVVGEVAPQAGEGALVGIGGHDWTVGPGLVDVLEDDDRLDDGAVEVEEDRDLIVDGVVEEEGGALVGEVFFHVLEVQALELEGKLHSVGVGAGP